MHRIRSFWQKQSIIAENWKTDTIVIGWAPGYIKGADKTAEEEVEAIISKLEE